MNKINLRAVDLNLLTIFQALMREGNVTRAGERLGLGQSAVSHALGRLRDMTGDELFVRVGRAMEPTERAKALMNDLDPALAQIETALRSRQTFDQETAEPVFRIGLTDDLQISLLPRLAEALRYVMPRSKLVTLTADYKTAGSLLERGVITTTMGYLPDLPAAAKVKKLSTIDYRVLRADAGRGKLTIDDYCNRPHALVTYAGDLRGLIDEALEADGRNRDVIMSVPQFGTLPSILSKTDYLATVPAYVARTFTALGGLRDEALPLASPTYDLSIAWRLVADSDPAEALLRKTMVSIFGTLTKKPTS